MRQPSGYTNGAYEFIPVTAWPIAIPLRYASKEKPSALRPPSGTRPAGLATGPSTRLYPICKAMDVISLVRLRFNIGRGRDLVELLPNGFELLCYKLPVPCHCGIGELAVEGPENEPHRNAVKASPK